jgi:large subunit ribosomal protein L19
MVRSEIMDVITSFEKGQKKAEIPAFNIGDTVRVSLRIKEGDKERLQPFEGIVIAKRNAASRSSFTVRKVSYGVGVERVIPLYSPALDSLKVVRRGDVRRAKLYYLRELRGKAARIKEKTDW